MKNIFFTTLLSGIIAIFLFLNFYTPNYIQPNDQAYHFALNSPSKQSGIAENLTYKASVQLDSMYYSLDNLQNIFHTDKYIVAYDGNTDFIERLCFFDKNTGKLEKEVQFPKSEGGEIASIRSVSHVPSKKLFYALSGYYQSILVYNEEGELVDEIYLGMYGSRMVALEDGNFLVEASMNERGIAEQHRYILFNQRGKVVRRFFPYHNDHVEFLFNISGLFTKIDKVVYCAWPGTDTIYRYNDEIFTPVVIAHFAENTIPAEKRQDDAWIKDGYFTDFSYFTPSFAIQQDQAIFSYINEKAQFTFGLGNLNNGSFLNARLAVADELSLFFKYSTILSSENGRIAIAVSAKKAKALLKNASPELTLLKKRQPDLYNTLAIAAQSKNPAILYFDMNFVI